MNSGSLAKEKNIGINTKSKSSTKKKIMKHWQLYLLIIPPVLYFLVFKYVPMFGVIIAFKDFNVAEGILGSPWVGLKHFESFFQGPYFWQLIKNTLGLSLYGLLAGFTAPIILALALNEVRKQYFKKLIQMITFAPYFISTVIMVSMLILLLNPNFGIVNNMLAAFNVEPINFMGEPGFFKSIYVWSDVWQNTGYAAIIYLAALAGVDPQLYEAANVDGASRFQKILHVDIPGILPIIVIMLILNVGNFMVMGFEKIYLMQNSLNSSSSEVIATYVYKVGLLGANYSFAGAVGLFNSIINLILIVSANSIARRVSNSSL